MGRGGEGRESSPLLTLLFLARVMKSSEKRYCTANCPAAWLTALLSTNTSSHTSTHSSCSSTSWASRWPHTCTAFTATASSLSSLMDSTRLYSTAVVRVLLSSVAATHLEALCEEFHVHHQLLCIVEAFQGLQRGQAHLPHLLWAGDRLTPHPPPSPPTLSNRVQPTYLR